MNKIKEGLEELLTKTSSWEMLLDSIAVFDRNRKTFSLKSQYNNFSNVIHFI